MIVLDRWAAKMVMQTNVLGTIHAMTRNGEEAMPDLPAPRLEFIFAAHVTVEGPLDFGDIGKGRRRVVPITGGEFSGPSIHGAVLGGGGDWQIIRGDGVAELDARYTLRTDDGALIHVRNMALRHGPPAVMADLAAGRPVAPGSYYFRGATFFETGAAQYAWLTRHIVICTGHREPDLVKIAFYRID
jgi:Protein of unknown function (DUF3237)